MTTAYTPFFWQNGLLRVFYGSFGKVLGVSYGSFGCFLCIFIVDCEPAVSEMQCAETARANSPRSAATWDVYININIEPSPSVSERGCDSFCH